MSQPLEPFKQFQYIPQDEHGGRAVIILDGRGELWIWEPEGRSSDSWQPYGPPGDAQ